MGILDEDYLRAATVNPNIMRQGILSRTKPPMQMNPLTTQGLLDGAALATSPVPILGDIVGLGADANRFITDPSSRTPANFGLAALGLIPFLPPLMSAGLGKFAQSQGKALGQLPAGPARNQAGAIVYHGSPHKFDAFDSSKIGTGEGAQAYGHGLYFAENQNVASKYAKPADWKWSPELAKDMDARHIYKVDLPDEAIAKMLDYDAPLSRQPEQVRNAIETALKDDKVFQAWKSNGAIDSVSGGILYKRIVDLMGPYAGGTVGAAGQQSAKATELLNSLGVPGIRYLDGGSRGAGEGTRNFVTFPGNEGLLKILERQ